LTAREYESSNSNVNREFPAPQLANSGTAIPDRSKRPKLETSEAGAAYFGGAGMKIFCPTFIFSGTKPGLAFRI
jgi:hypothetical protein